MARLTDRELNLIQGARRTPSWPTWDDTDAILLAARQARAKMIARWVGRSLVPLAGAAATARSVTRRAFLPLRRDLLRRRTVNELYRLEDRILADIGIAREQIEPIAEDLALAALPPRMPRAGIMISMRSWLRRRAAIRELEALDDRLLADIGLRRRGIREAVQRAAAEALAAPAAGGPSTVGLPATRPWVPVRLVNRLSRTVQRWLQRRATIRELQALDDRMLADIGMLRRDIPSALDWRMASGRRAAAAPIIEQASYWDSVVRGLRNWETSRKAARETLRSGRGAAAERDTDVKNFNRIDSAASGIQARQHKAA